MTLLATAVPEVHHRHQRNRAGKQRDGSWRYVIDHPYGAADPPG